MKFFNDNIIKSVRQISEKAEEAVNDAIQQAANAKQMLARHGVEKHILDQINQAHEAVESIVEKISTLKNQIASERRPVQEKISEMQEAVAKAKAEVDHITSQIQAKEKEIHRLTRESFKIKNVWPLGKIKVPDPQAIARAGALRVEVAGLHGAMANAKKVLASVTHELEALHVEALRLPIEADPRIIALHKELEAEKNAIGALTQKAVGAARKALEVLFTAENRHKLAAKASQEINTGLPDTVEEALFFDAIEKIEKTVLAVLPGKVLTLIQDAEQGISGGTKAFEKRLIDKVNAQVDIPMIDEKQEKALFSILISTLVEAMKPGTTMDTILSES